MACFSGLVIMGWVILLKVIDLSYSWNDTSLFLTSDLSFRLLLLLLVLFSMVNESCSLMLFLLSCNYSIYSMIINDGLLTVASSRSYSREVVLLVREEGCLVAWEGC